MLAMPLGIRELLDAAVLDRDRRLLTTIALGLLALFLLRGWLSFVGQLRLRMAAERVVGRLRVQIYEHLQRMDLGFFARERVAELTARLAADVSQARVAISDTLANGISTVLKLVGSVAIIIALNHRLAGIILLIAPIVALSSRRLGERTRQLAGQVQDRLAETTVVAQEGLAGIRLVQAYAREDHESARYRAAIDGSLSSMAELLRYGTLFAAVMESLVIAVIVAVYWYGGSEVISQRLGPGALVASVFYAQNIGQAIAEAVQTYVSYSSAAGASARLFGMLDATPAVAEPPVVTRMSARPHSVTLDSVSFRYGEGAEVLSGVSLRVEPGETVAIVGRSGAGKTTLLNLIPRLIDAQKGCVMIGNTDVRSLSLAELRSQVALVSQDVYLFNQSLRANIRYGRLDATDAEVERAAQLANAHDFIQSLPRGYDTLPGEVGVRLSGGERQRIAIARALLKDAPILLLDEATSSLDASNEAAIQDAVHRLQQGRTTLLVTHRLRSIEHVRRIALLDLGRLTAIGTHDELTAVSPAYASIATARSVIGA